MLLKASDGTKIRRTYLGGESTRTPFQLFGFLQTPQQRQIKCF